VSKDRSAAGGNTASVGAFQSGVMPPAVGNRLPIARRERKPALAALAVLLILAGALATMVLVNRSGNRISAIMVTHTVAAGTKIRPEDLTEVRVAADNNIHYVLLSQENQVVGQTTANTLVAGSLLVTEMLGSQQQRALKDGEAMIGLLFKVGQYPSGQLLPGQTVEIWATSTGGSSGGSTAGTASGGTQATTPAKPLCTARILAYTYSGDALNLTLAVPDAQVGQLEGLAGNLSVALTANSANAPAQ
jgi:hypothetical protein